MAGDVYAYLEAAVGSGAARPDRVCLDRQRRHRPGLSGRDGGCGAVGSRSLGASRHGCSRGDRRTAIRLSMPSGCTAPGAPTILVYGHYDVQPPDPLDKWRSDPFAPQVREGRLYGRGVSDDKGPMLIPLLAAQAYMATAGRLPVNVKFLFEGEEEVGSPSLELLIAQERRSGAGRDFALSAGVGHGRIDDPLVTVSSRGMTGLEFRLARRGQGPALRQAWRRRGESAARARRAGRRATTPDGRGGGLLRRRRRVERG